MDINILRKQPTTTTTTISKSEYCLSPQSHLSFHSNNASSSYCYHEPFQSSTSCTHTNNSSLTTTNGEHYGSTTLNSISTDSLSNSPAVIMKITKQRRNSLNLSNSYSTINDHDANGTIFAEDSPNPPPPNTLKCNTLSVPMYDTDIQTSADEYDSDAHLQTDEALIIKRVLAKFNQQNKQIIRKNLSFIDSFNFFQNNINEQNNNNSSKQKKKKKNKRRRNISIGHSKLLQDLSRRAIIQKTPNITQRKESSKHCRQITPFDPIDIDCLHSIAMSPPPMPHIDVIFDENESTTSLHQSFSTTPEPKTSSPRKFRERRHVKSNTFGIIPSVIKECKTQRRTASIIPNMDTNINGDGNDDFVSNIFAVLNETDHESDRDHDNETSQNVQNIIKVKAASKKRRRKHVKSATVGSPRLGLSKKNNTKNNGGDYVYQTWNYLEELSDDLKSDYHSDTKSDEDNESESDEEEINNLITYGTERVFSTFAKELAINCENPTFIFESLLQICQSLKSETKSHKISFDAPLLLSNERIITFLKLLGFVSNIEQNAYVLEQISDFLCIDHAILACQQQLIEISKKSATYNIINNRFRNHIPPLIEENKSMQTNDNFSQIDADSCHLYELIWSATHQNNTDHNAKEVILLCFCMITSNVKFFKLLEARFFNADNGRTSYSLSTNSDSPWTSPLSGSPSIPSSVPSLSLPPLGLNSLTLSPLPSITFEYEKICSSYCVQKKVTHLILLWMQSYFVEDWYKNEKLLTLFDEFVEKANKAYKNDIDFDQNERKKGLELVTSMNKMLKKKKAEQRVKCKFSDNDNDTNNEYDSQKIPALNEIFEPRILNEIDSVRTRGLSAGSGKNKYDKTQIAADPFRKREKKKIRKKPKHKRKISFSPTLKFSVDHSLSIHDRDLLKISNEAICNQMGVYLFKKFVAIKPRECLYEYGMKSKSNSMGSNIQRYKDAFNQIVKWVQSTILIQPQTAKRARIIKKWIKITDLLFNLRCFQGFVAVQCALASNAIFSLKSAWNQSNVLKQKHLTKWKEIGVIMSASHNFENLRRLQREAHAPLIPYFGLFCKDLIYIQEGVKKRNKDGMINWNKFWRIHEQINEHLQYQKVPYSRIIKEDISMQTWLDTELKRAGTLKSELLDMMSRDVALKDKSKKLKKRIGHKKSFTLMQ